MQCLSSPATPRVAAASFFAGQMRFRAPTATPCPMVPQGPCTPIGTRFAPRAPLRRGRPRPRCRPLSCALRCTSLRRRMPPLGGFGVSVGGDVGVEVAAASPNVLVPWGPLITAVVPPATCDLLQQPAMDNLVTGRVPARLRLGDAGRRAQFSPPDGDGWRSVLPGRRRHISSSSRSESDSRSRTPAIPPGLLDRCFNCLSSGHRVASCRLPTRCLRCRGFRHVARDCKRPRFCTGAASGRCGHKPCRSIKSGLPVSSTPPDSLTRCQTPPLSPGMPERDAGDLGHQSDTVLKAQSRSRCSSLALVTARLWESLGSSEVHLDGVA